MNTPTTGSPTSAAPSNSFAAARRPVVLTLLAIRRASGRGSSPHHRQRV